MNRQSNFRGQYFPMKRGFERDREINNIGSSYEVSRHEDQRAEYKQFNQINYDEYQDTDMNMQGSENYDSIPDRYAHKHDNSGFRNDFSRDNWSQNTERNVFQSNNTPNMTNEYISQRTSWQNDERNQFNLPRNGNNDDYNGSDFDAREYLNRKFSEEELTSRNEFRSIQNNRPTPKMSLECPVCDLKFDEVEDFQAHSISSYHINNAALAAQRPSDLPISRPMQFNQQPRQQLNFQSHNPKMMSMESLTDHGSRERLFDQETNFTPRTYQEGSSHSGHAYKEGPSPVSHTYQERSMPIKQTYQERFAPTSPTSQIRPLMEQPVYKKPLLHEHPPPIKSARIPRINKRVQNPGILGSFNSTYNPASKQLNKRTQQNSGLTGRSNSDSANPCLSPSFKMPAAKTKNVGRKWPKKNQKGIKQSVQQMVSQDQSKNNSRTHDQKMETRPISKSEPGRDSSRDRDELQRDEDLAGKVMYAKQLMDIELTFKCLQESSKAPPKDPESVIASGVVKESMSFESLITACSEDRNEVKNDTGNDLMDVGDDAGDDDPIGQEYVIPGFFCKLCSRFFNKETIAKQTHCKTEEHIAKYKKAQGLKN